VSIHEVVIIGVVLMGPILLSVALWLRLHFQSRSERERLRCVLAAATELPAGSRRTAVTEPAWPLSSVPSGRTRNSGE
jgi:hypothetical protein